MGSVLGTIKDVIDAQRSAGLRIGALGITSFRPFPIDAVRQALKGARHVVVVEKAFSVGFGGVLSTDVAMALTGLAVPVATVVAGLGGRAITKASLQRVLRGGPRRRAGPADLPRPEHGLGRAGARAHGPKPPVRTLGREHAPGHGCSRFEDRLTMAVHFYQVGSFAVGNRLVDVERRTVQSDAERPNSLTSGHRACQGCGEALGARYALDAAMRATEGQMVAVNATGCLEVFSTPYPETSWKIAWLHSLFGNAPAVATGVAAALRAKGRGATRVIGQAGDGGTVDIGFGCLSGMFERNDDVLFICYDNEAYMNTGVQRSGATPPAARTATTEAVGPDPGTPSGRARTCPSSPWRTGSPTWRPRPWRTSTIWRTR